MFHMLSRSGLFQFGHLTNWHLRWYSPPIAFSRQNSRKPVLKNDMAQGLEPTELQYPMHYHVWRVQNITTRIPQNNLNSINTLPKAPDPADSGQATCANLHGTWRWHQFDVELLSENWAILLWRDQNMIKSRGYVCFDCVWKFVAMMAKQIFEVWR